MENNIKVLIADDEQLARERMRVLLEPFSGIEIIGEARNGSEVVKLCSDLSVDLVFLDIQMPGLTGLDAADVLHKRNIQFVFVSAFGEHALEAFELQALDYLTKPVRPSRLEQAIKRVIQFFRGTGHQKSQLSGRIAVLVGKKTTIIALKDLMYATVFDGSMEIHTAGKCHYLAWTLKHLEDAIGDHQPFFKVNRQTLLNLDYLKSVEYTVSEVTLINGKTLELSRSASKKLREIL